MCKKLKSEISEFFFLSECLTMQWLAVVRLEFMTIGKKIDKIIENYAFCNQNLN